MLRCTYRRLRRHMVIRHRICICQLPFVNCPLPIALCQLPSANCPLPISICQLPFAKSTFISREQLAKGIWQRAIGKGQLAERNWNRGQLSEGNWRRAICRGHFFRRALRFGGLFEKGYLKRAF